MHRTFKRPDGRIYGAYTGLAFLKDAVGFEGGDELMREYRDTAVEKRVQVGSFLFFALSRILSDAEHDYHQDGDEAAIYKRCAGGRVVDVLRQEQGLVSLPDDGNGATCQHCGVHAVVTLPAVQLRSGDEPETFITQCAA